MGQFRLWRVAHPSFFEGWVKTADTIKALCCAVCIATMETTTCTLSRGRATVDYPSLFGRSGKSTAKGGESVGGDAGFEAAHGAGTAAQAKTAGLRTP